MFIRVNVTDNRLGLVLLLILFCTQEGMNMMHCAAVNDHTDIVEYIVNDLQMKELDKEDHVGHDHVFLY